MTLKRNGRFAHLKRPRPGFFFAAEEGATAVEFALTAPVFLAFIYGVLELARAMFTQGVLIYAAQEGSRYAAARSASTPAEIEEVVRGSFLAIDPASATLTVVPILNADGTRIITVTITYRFRWVVPLFGTDAVTLDASSSSWAG